MNFGVIATGPMAQKFVDTLKFVPEAKLYAVSSRTIEKAENFKNKNHFEKAYSSYEDLVKDEKVDIVYIATPHSMHYDCMKLCIENHKAVLCEKPFTVNARQAEEIKELAQKNKVFVAEAIWPRYMPSRRIINEVIKSNIIGRPRILTANLSYVISEHARITDPKLAGGALLDVGVYGLNFALMHFGDAIERIESSVQKTSTGVDGQESITIKYNDGKMAVLTHGIYSRSDRKGIIYGDQGYMVVENINNPNKILVYDTNDKLLKTYDVPPQISGYEYEAEECINCIKNGELEARSMPLDETIKIMRIMDSIRHGWDLVYPQEK